MVKEGGDVKDLTPQVRGAILESDGVSQRTFLLTGAALFVIVMVGIKMMSTKP